MLISNLRFRNIQ